MTTSKSPTKKLLAQATKIAANLKRMELREVVLENGARERDGLSFSVVMDDKVLEFHMAWNLIRDTPEAGLVEYFVRVMREDKVVNH